MLINITARIFAVSSILCYGCTSNISVSKNIANNEDPLRVILFSVDYNNDINPDKWKVFGAYVDLVNNKYGYSTKLSPQARSIKIIYAHILENISASDVKSLDLKERERYIKYISSYTNNNPSKKYKCVNLISINGKMLIGICIYYNNNINPVTELHNDKDSDAPPPSKEILALIRKVYEDAKVESPLRP